MLHHYDHRWSTYSDDGSTRDFSLEEKQAPATVALPRYWVAEQEVNALLAAKSWDRDWLLGWRDIAKIANERTMVGAAFRRSAVGNQLPVITSGLADVAGLVAAISSYVVDFVVRQKAGGTHLNFFIMQQIPIYPPDYGVIDWHRSRSVDGWLLPRVLELTYTTYDMEPFARDLGESGAPFRWDEERRFLLRAELDAAFFHLYGIERDDADYIMETFPIAKRKDEAKYGAYRTKTQILAVYDAMARAKATGNEYQTILDPPPGQGPRHPAKATTVSS
jgi:hypothetical protein